MVLSRTDPVRMSEIRRGAGAARETQQPDEVYKEA